MSDEPLPATLEEAAERVALHGESEVGSDFSLARVRGGWVVLTWLGRGEAAYTIRILDVSDDELGDRLDAFNVEQQMGEQDA